MLNLEGLQHAAQSKEKPYSGFAPYRTVQYHFSASDLNFSTSGMKVLKYLDKKIPTIKVGIFLT
jgi:hypothetical protein